MIIRWKSLLSLALFAVLGFQLLRSMRIDAYELTSERFDIIGYWFCLIVSLLFVLNSAQNRKLNLSAVVLVLSFLAYAVLVIIFTDQDRSILAFLISRFGLLMWFSIGLGVGAMLLILERARESNANRYLKIGFLIALMVLGVLAVSFSMSYISSPVYVSTESYQSVATSASIFLVAVIVTIDALWGNNKPTAVVVGYLIVGTSLVGAVVLMQSTSIVVVWIGLIALFLWGELINSRLSAKLVIAICIVVGVIYTTQTEAFERITNSTRFNVFFGADGEFSSTASRQSILETFWSQFAVSPLFGHFRAEIISGVGYGEFIHSLPLSFLTHTGLIGGGLILMSLFIALKDKMLVDRGNLIDVHLARLMVLVILIGTISTFLTWALFWFMLGVLCHKPIQVNLR